MKVVWPSETKALTKDVNRHSVPRTKTHQVTAEFFTTRALSDHGAIAPLGLVRRISTAAPREINRAMMRDKSPTTTRRENVVLACRTARAESQK